MKQEANEEGGEKEKKIEQVLGDDVKRERDGDERR